MQTAAQTRRETRANSIPLEAIKPDGNGGYWVPSSDRKKSYYVTATSCTCADFRKRAVVCKHRLAVERLCPPSKFVGDPFDFGSPVQPKPTPTLEEELAALQVRKARLRERQESADRGYGKFSSLNAQNCRASLARIQEREIEIQELLMNIEIVEGEDKGAVMSIGEFLKINEFEDDHAAEIREALNTFGEYSDGGGAAPLWTIRVTEKK